MKWKVILVAAAFLASSGPGWTQEPVKDEDVQPRVIWGILIQMAISRLASAAWDVFGKWLENRVPAITDRSAAPNLSVDSGARIKPRSTDAVAERSAGSVVGNPTEPLTVDGGKQNYQGVHVALVAQAQDGKDFAYRPISAGFRTGERFKLRVVSTIAGELTLENINPRGERRHLYPAMTGQVVALQPGRETFLPLGKDEYFQFARAAGREQLVVNLADPRAVGRSASRHQVYRQDVQYGSNFLQQVAPNTYPRISQAIELSHSAH